MLAQTYAALTSIATTIVNPENSDALKKCFADIENWQEFTRETEIHGLSVMAGYLAKNHDLNLPKMVDLQLKALTIRHQKVLKARETVLADVIDIFEGNNITFALLKGAALSPLIYNPPWLRPMRDIDILVTPDSAQSAQVLLRDIDFKNKDFTKGYMFNHHHLPNSTRIQDGFTISLEVHHDALSGDVDASIKLVQSTDKLHSFDFADKRAYSLGHTDALMHLCHHTFEPAKTIKIGSMIDMVHYAGTFSSEIDWPTLRSTHPRIENTLRCIDALIPLPENLKQQLGIKGTTSWNPSGLGQGFIPLTQISALKSKKDKLRELLLPSQWWTHIFYGIAPDRSLHFTRTIRHPYVLMKWIFRRYWAAYQSKNI